MSPTEFDLRNALRDGEGDEPDVDHVVAGAHAARSLRRTRILSTAAAVVIVAGAAVGGAALVSHNNGKSDQNSAGSVAAAREPAATNEPAAVAAPAAGGTRHGPNPAQSEKSASTACPATYPHTLLAGGGSPGQFGASGQLFTKPVSSIVVCSYTDVHAASTSTSPGRTVLTGESAQTLASSLENALKTPSKTACPDYIVADAPSLAIIAVSTDGTVLPTVTTMLGRPACHTQVSNGTVVRYGWAPPSTLSAKLPSASSASSPSTASGGLPGANGTPLH